MYNIAYMCKKVPIPSLFMAFGVLLIAITVYANTYFMHHELLKEVLVRTAEALIVISSIYSIRFFASRPEKI